MSKVFALTFTKDDQLSFAEAFMQIPIDDLNRKERAIVVKVGIFSLSEKPLEEYLGKPSLRKSIYR